MSPGRATAVARARYPGAMQHLACSCELPGEPGVVDGGALHLIGPGCLRARRARFATLYRHLAEAAIEVEAARRARARRARRRSRRVTGVPRG